MLLYAYKRIFSFVGFRSKKDNQQETKLHNPVRK
jgi:hypothetical protein